MRKKIDALGNVTYSCPGCGMMSFPPVLKPTPDVNKQPTNTDKVITKPKEPNEVLDDCPGCGMMAFEEPEDDLVDAISSLKI